MTPDASLAVQTALYARLTAAPALAGPLGGRIHDRRPEALGFPHLVLGEAMAQDDGCKSRDGQSHLVTLHLWSRYRGRAEAKTLLGLVAAALHRQPLDLGPDHAWVASRVVATLVLDEADGVTCHGILRLRVLTAGTQEL